MITLRLPSLNNPDTPDCIRSRTGNSHTPSSIRFSTARSRSTTSPVSDRKIPATASRTLSCENSRQAPGRVIITPKTTINTQARRFEKRTSCDHGAPGSSPLLRTAGGSPCPPPPGTGVMS